MNGTSDLRSTDMHRVLLEWYRPRRTAYPWRSARQHPFRVLVSEVMLQQTQAARVAPAFERFVARFPTVESLAAAPRSEVLRAWSGLGYNRRAVALSEAARTIVRDHQARVPAEPEELDHLPGIGPYTAAAVASVGYGRPVAAVDTNARRVVSRAVLGVDERHVGDRAVHKAAREWLDPSAPGRWNQAVMDLGREICRPQPLCDRCPLADGCRFRSGAGSPQAAGRRPRRQPPFEGSPRQARGRVIAALREQPSATLAAIGRGSGLALERIAAAVRSLAKEGLIEAGPAALRGHPRGRIRLSSN